MPVVLAFWLLVAVWSTTPLGIASSNHSLTFWTAAALRMVLALSVLLVIVSFRRRPLIPNRQALLAYLVAALAICPQVSLVYWAAQFVPTGVVSLSFALSPCFTCLASLVFLRDSRLNLRQVIALPLALAGMAIIYRDQINISAAAGWGIAALILSTTIFATCSVWIKRLTMDTEIDPVSQTTATQLFALPLMVVCWYVFDGEVPTSISWQSATAVVYLATVGSVAGFSLYFYVLRTMNVVTVSLTTLITPVFAIFIGVVFLDEPLTLSLLLGSGVVLFALLLFEGLLARWWRYLSARRTVTEVRAYSTSSGNGGQ